MKAIGNSINQEREHQEHDPPRTNQKPATCCSANDDLLLQFGKSESAGAGVAKMFFDKQARKRVAAYAGSFASLLDEYLDLYAVVGQDMAVITVGHRTERIRRH